MRRSEDRNKYMGLVLSVTLAAALSCSSEPVAEPVARPTLGQNGLPKPG